MFAAMWKRELKMEDAATIERALAAAELDAARVVHGAHEPEVKTQLTTKT